MCDSNGIGINQDGQPNHVIRGVIPPGTILTVAGLQYHTGSEQGDRGEKSVKNRLIYGENEQTPNGGVKSVQIGNDFLTHDEFLHEWITENAVAQTRPRKKGGSKKKCDKPPR